MNSTTRLSYLDNLKVMLTILVVFHHAALPYSPGSEWAYTTSHPEEMMPWIWHFLSVNASFFMGLFFLISGYFVPMSFDRQGMKTFVLKKLMRLGIPVLVIATLLSVLTGQLEVGHLWYVESLLFFCLIYAVLRHFVSPVGEGCSSRPTLVGMLIVALIMGVGGYFIRQVSPQDNWIWLLGFIHIEPAHYLQYAMMLCLVSWHIVSSGSQGCPTSLVSSRSLSAWLSLSVIIFVTMVLGMVLCGNGSASMSPCYVYSSVSGCYGCSVSMSITQTGSVTGVPNRHTALTSSICSCCCSSRMQQTRW